MAIRGSSLAGMIIPVGGPAGRPGQPGKDGVTQDISGLLPKNGDASGATAIPSAGATDGTLAKLLAGVAANDGAIAPKSQLATADWVRAFGAGHANILGGLSPAQIADVLNNVGSIDLTAAIQIYCNALGPARVLWPAGTYRIAGTITPPAGQSHIGACNGWNNGSIISVPGSPSAPTFVLDSDQAVESMNFIGTTAAQEGHAFVRIDGRGAVRNNFFFGGYAQVYLNDHAFYARIEANHFLGGAVYALRGVSATDAGFDFIARGNRFLGHTPDRTISIFRFTGLGSGIWTDNQISAGGTNGPLTWFETIAPLYGGWQASSSVNEQTGSQPACRVQGTSDRPIPAFNSMNCFYTGDTGAGVELWYTLKAKFVGGGIASKSTLGAFQIQSYGNSPDISLSSVEFAGVDAVSPIQFAANSTGSINLTNVTWPGSAPLLDASAIGPSALGYVNASGGNPGTATQPLKVPAGALVSAIGTKWGTSATAPSGDVSVNPVMPAGRVSRQLAAKLAELTATGLDFGSVEDAATDDAAKITAGLSAVASKTRDLMIQGRSYCNSAIVVPAGVTLRGPSTATADSAVPHAPHLQRGVIIMGPNCTISVGQGGRVTGLYLIQAGVATPPTSAADLSARIAAYSGTAIQITGSDARVEDNFIMGFANGIQSIGTSQNPIQRPTIRRNMIDATNGIEVTYSLDIPRVEDNEAFPFYSVSTGLSTDGALTQRSGKGFYVHDTADGAFVRGNFTYGYKIGYQFTNLFAVKAVDNTADNFITASSGDVGFLTTGSMNSLLFDGNHADSSDIDFDFQHNSGAVVGGANSAGQAITQQVRFGAGAAANFGQWALGGPSSTALINFQTGVGKVHIGSVILHTNSRTGNAYVFTAADRANINIGRTILSGVATVDNLNPSTDVEVKPASNQTPAAGASVVVALGTVVRDTATEFQTANNAFVAKVAGRYTFDVSLAFSSATASSSQVIVELWKNGAAAERVYSLYTTDVGARLFGRSVTLDLAASDGIQLVAYLGVGGTIDANNTKLKIRPVRTP